VRVRWRVVGSCVWLLSCQDGYPIAPTACDDWCEATKEFVCTSVRYEPARCVALCEEQGFTHKEGCEAQLRAVIECYASAPPPPGPRCSAASDMAAPECASKTAELTLCMSSSARESAGN
jgi:hypothetical protein